MMVHSVLNKSWKQHPTKQQLYGHLLPFSQEIRSRKNSWKIYFYILLYMDILLLAEKEKKKKKKLHSSTLYGHRMPSRIITSSDCWYGQMARESLRNMNCRYALMLMKIMILFQHHVRMGIAVFCLSTYRYLFSSFVMVSQIIPL